jgi:hypothetical protein
MLCDYFNKGIMPVDGSEYFFHGIANVFSQWAKNVRDNTKREVLEYNYFYKDKKIKYSRKQMNDFMEIFQSVDFELDEFVSRLAESFSVPEADAKLIWQSFTATFDV